MRDERLQVEVDSIETKSKWIRGIRLVRKMVK